MVPQSFSCSVMPSDVLSGSSQLLLQCATVVPQRFFCSVLPLRFSVVPHSFFCKGVIPLRSSVVPHSFFCKGVIPLRSSVVPHSFFCSVIPLRSSVVPHRLFCSVLPSDVPSSYVQCCFTSTETVRTRPRTSNSTLTQLLSSEYLSSVSLYVHRDRKKH